MQLYRGRAVKTGLAQQKGDRFYSGTASIHLKDSPEEDLYCYELDLFKVGR